ncbi:uncharacterized protein METZ01_LOCUS469102, partial [marine metagenome]
MKTTLPASLKRFFLPVLAFCLASFASAAEIPKWVDLFNGKDLTGWVDVNTSPDT